MYEQFFLTKEHRIKEISVQLAAIQKELSDRDLSEIPTEKLLDLNLRCLERAEKEYQEPKFQLRDNRTKTKLDSQGIAFELYDVLLRFRAGGIDAVTASREHSILMAMLKSEE